MASYLDLQNRIADDLSRSDLGSQIKNAIQDAIDHYEHDRFWFNTTRTKTFPTVIGQTVYTGSDLAEIPNVIEFDNVFLRDGVSTTSLRYFEVDQFEVLTSLNTSNGKPGAYTYADGTLMLWAPPAAVYTIRPHMHYRLSTLSADTDSNAWCNEAEQLIRSHAKLLLYTDVLEDDAGAQRMQNKIPALKAKLDEETAARSASGQIRGTNF